MPTRKPAYVKRREGNRSRVPIKDDLETFGRPQEPPHLTPAQLERWHAVVSALPPGLLTAADTQVVERLAVAWALFRETSEKIAATSLLVRGVDGNLVRNPLVVVQK